MVISPLPSASLFSGDLDAGVDGPVVWIACDCGARIARRADEGDALAFNGWARTITSPTST
jgi:hypothetical protein